ncbi:fibronectin type III domain-containing protein [Flavobacterium sp. N502536]|uniref:fibronectin type III domain-containing protein n=1 Tax=Flavobacterium sp. N502536 TaxID=2986837 RepID=UPI002223A7FF|nr:fibronectin type III domain-containing protein [Flavobacterium sp. N502536]
MKKVNFNHSGGFPLEQETLERLQKADKSELYEALKAHLSLDIAFNYILASPKNGTKGLAIVHQGEKDSQDKVENRGILYPISPGNDTGYLKTTRSGTNLVYGDGTSQTAYFDYEAQYISQTEYDTADKSGTNNTESSTVYYYELKNFRKVMDLETLEAILTGLDNSFKANTKTIGEHTNLISDNTKDIGDHAKLIGDNTYSIEKIKEDYLPRNGSKSMTGNLTVDGKLYLNNTNSANSDGSILVLDSSNQVIKGNSLINPLLNRVTDLVNRVIELEKKQTSAIPIGMIAIWGKSGPFPEGWEEYVPLRGRVPVGLDKLDSLLSNIGDEGGSKNAVVVSHNHTITSSGNINDGKPGGEINSKTARWDTGSGSLLNGTISTVGESGINKNMQPYRVVYFIKYTGEPSDQTPPTAPMTLQATNISSTSVTLSWGESNDTVGVTNYQIFINNVFALNAGKVLNHDVNGLLPGTKYKFHVVANDQAGNSSANSNFVEETTRLTRPEITNGMLETSKDIFLQWNSSPANENIIGYEIWRSGHNGIFEKIGTSYTPGYADAKTEYSTTYFYKVKSLNGVGNFSDLSKEFEMTTDTDPNLCFDIESLVTVASGQSKKLKNIVIGDKLQGFSFPNEIDESEGNYMTWNGKLTEAVKAEVTVTDKKTSIQPNFYEIKTPDTTIKVTGEHPLLVTEDGENLKWTRAKNVQQTMLLIDKLGKTKPIESIVFKEEPLEVALLDVENVDNYVISGIVAHNTKRNPGL